MVYKKLNKFELFAGLFTALVIGLVYISLNFNYLSTWVDEKGDVLTYDHYVRLGIPQYLFNPHHIGFDWLGERFFAFLKERGYTGSAMTALQMRNLLCSGLGLGIVFFLFYKISRKYLLSLLIVATYAFTAAYWIYSQINDTPIIHSILVFILFLLTLYFPQAKHKKLYAFFLGLLHAVTIFFHQSDLIMMAVVIFVMFGADLFAEDRSQRRIAWRHTGSFLIYLSTFVVIVVTAYYYVGIVLIGLTLDPKNAHAFNNIEGSSYFFNWLILYAKIDYWGKGFDDDRSLLAKVVHGIITYFYQPQLYKGVQVAADYAHFWKAASVLPNLIGLLFMSVFGGALLFFRSLLRSFRYGFIAVLLYMSIYTVFSCWWEADYREFWVATMFAFWFLMLIVFSVCIDKMGIFRLPVKLALYTFVLLLAGLLFYFNFTGFLYPYAGKTYRTYEIVR